jgi:hypothetical protein
MNQGPGVERTTQKAKGKGQNTKVKRPCPRKSDRRLQLIADCLMLTAYYLISSR